MAEAAAISACPACSGARPDIATALPEGEGRILLSLPGIHCAGCISGVEQRLLAVPEVRSARVNLTLKRVSVEVGSVTEPADLIAILADAGYEAHELDSGALSATATDKAGRDLLMRLGVSGFAMMNVMLLSVSVWSGAEAATRDLFHWISAGIALPTIVFSAQPFFRNAWRALSGRRLNMDVPISLAILLAAGMSLYETAHSGAHAYFDAALSLTFFLLAGRYLDHRTRAVARSAAEELAALEVPRATRLLGEVEETVPISTLAVGDHVLVRPGGRMPVDGQIISGQSEVDRSLLTGESVPVFAGAGDQVSAGEVNLTGPLTVQVSSAGEDTSLHRMADLVAMAEAGRNKYTSLADRAAAIYAPGVHLLALFAFLGWLWGTGGDVRLALNIAVAVLIITCPCALGLAVPAVTTAASGRLFRDGMLIKHTTALERLAEVNAVVFDKTGTLTEGRPEPVNLAELSEEKLGVSLSLAGASSHPLAQALVRGAAGHNTRPEMVSDITENPGFGIEGKWNGQVVRLGRAEWLDADPVPSMATYLRIGDAAPVAIRFADTLRAGAKDLVFALQARNIQVSLISGDEDYPVKELADRLGITHWQSRVRPDGKAAEITRLTEAGAKVLMIGDGLNDTAALTAAHVSISPASALDAARVASDIVLLGSDLTPISGALITAQKATRRIVENFAIAAGYNMIAIPIALAGFATPLAAALAMSLSSITVSVNALRLR